MVQLIDLLDGGDNQAYNRSVAHGFGSVSAAIMLLELIDRYRDSRDKEQLKSVSGQTGCWFCYTAEDCEKRTVLSPREQGKGIGVIEKRGLFSKISHGVPSKRYFRINVSNIEAFIKTFDDVGVE